MAKLLVIAARNSITNHRKPNICPAGIIANTLGKTLNPNENAENAWSSRDRQKHECGWNRNQPAQTDLENSFTALAVRLLRTTSSFRFR